MSWDEPFSDTLISGDLLPRLQARLLAHGYTEEGVSALCGLEVPTVRAGSSRDLLLPELQRSDEPLALLVRLFFLRDAVETEALLTIFEADELAQMRSSDLLEATPEGDAPARLTAAIAITPCGGVLIGSDPLWLSGDRFGAGGPVMVPGEDTEVLLRATPRAHVGRVLDLGTGPGPHALVASLHAEEVVGVDIAPRALAFARLNARLNGASAVRFHRGDLLVGNGPLAEQYELVLSNPPFVPTLHSEVLYRHGGGPLGDEVLNGVLARLPEWLAPGGQARIVADVVFRSEEDLESKLVSVLGEAVDELDVMGIEDRPFDLRAYAESHSTRLIDGEMTADPGGGEALLRHFEAQHVSRIAHVLLALKRTDGGGRRQFRRVPRLREVRAVHIDRVLALWQRLRAEGEACVALSARPLPLPGVRLVLRRYLASRVPDELEIEFGSDAPWSNSRTNEVLFDLLSQCDGERSGRELSARLASERGLRPEEAEGFVTRALVSLAEFGVIELGGVV